MMQQPGPTSPCPQARQLFDEASSPSVTFVRLSQIRNEFAAMNCASCAGAFETELKFRSMLATSCSEVADPGLVVRITEQLTTIDLSQLDVSDIEF